MGAAADTSKVWLWGTNGGTVEVGNNSSVSIYRSASAIVGGLSSLTKEGTGTLSIYSAQDPDPTKEITQKNEIGTLNVNNGTISFNDKGLTKSPATVTTLNVADAGTALFNSTATIGTATVNGSATFTKGQITDLTMGTGSDVTIDTGEVSVTGTVDGADDSTLTVNTGAKTTFTGDSTKLGITNIDEV